MTCNSKKNRRSAAVLLEFAIVASVFLLLTIGTISVSLGVFRYQAVASVAREASRWASVHGGMYHKEQGGAIPTAKDVYTNAIVPQLAGLDPAQVTYKVTWSDPNQMPGSTVTVTISYNWVPEVYVAPVTLSSVSVTTMQY